ncbi:hypothetical protein MKZ38_002995 [Zalerion maritima]|uniref:Protein kinase domain-containing protein n=1 Tax=Zalerion maritima TaxID=339359 RepID=A0AAD5RN73_9PEZI|nr:hypothetical protein MKZ38_002995 [Zalerion maritima]
MLPSKAVPAAATTDIMPDSDSSATSPSTGDGSSGGTTEPAMPLISPASTAASLCRLPTLEYLDYHAGSVLDVRVDPAENNENFSPTLKVRVEKVIEPRTMSCGMLVRVQEEGKPPRPAFLKVFGTLSRYMETLRRCHEGEGAEGLPIGDKYFGENMTPQKWDALSVSEREHAFQQKMRKIHHDEREAYRRLVKHQGAEVPNLYASVYLGWHPPDTGNPDTNEKYGHMLEVRALLLEYINGWELLSFPTTLSARTVSKLYDEALAITRMIGAHGVLNYDVKLDNFMVTPDPRKGGHRICMIDLGFSHFRRREYTTAQWAKLKALAWDGETNQMCIEARRIFAKRFPDSEGGVSLNSKSEYGFLVADQHNGGARPKGMTSIKKCPAGWERMQTSRGTAFVNPKEIECDFPCCRPHKDFLGEVQRMFKKVVPSRKNTPMPSRAVTPKPTPKLTPQTTREPDASATPRESPTKGEPNKG